MTELALALLVAILSVTLGCRINKRKQDRVPHPSKDAQRGIYLR